MKVSLVSTRLGTSRTLEDSKPNYFQVKRIETLRFTPSHIEKTKKLPSSKRFYAKQSNTNKHSLTIDGSHPKSIPNTSHVASKSPQGRSARPLAESNKFHSLPGCLNRFREREPEKPINNFAALARDPQAKIEKSEGVALFSFQQGTSFISHTSPSEASPKACSRNKDFCSPVGVTKTSRNNGSECCVVTFGSRVT